ncbi:hypothetical protein IZ6_25540 [Terrihabitans soli]|uniref:Uncharacterized protein n=2 Tax=Terrihabitans soli TaxID=708113 RepID=A0A6S6QRY0_9HYPH|nr:hypothetical protein IZ6_25540 [Terrihabitans soli]
MLNRDGDFIFYTVECKRREGLWHVVGDTQLAVIPAHLRFKNGRGHDGFLEPTRSFGACGDVWQLIRQSGYWEPELAYDLLRLLTQYNRGESFRVTKVRLTQSRTELALYQNSVTRELVA